MSSTRRRISTGGLVAIVVVSTLATGQASAEVARPLCHGQRATMVGSAHGDRLVGTAGRDVIVARGGDDVIVSGAGDDIVCAGSGRDRVFSGADDDSVFSGPGGDLVVDPGSRHEWDGQSFDTGSGDDRVRLHGARAFGEDYVELGPGDDTLDATGQPWLANDVWGGWGDDLIETGGGRDFLSGGPGHDVLRGGTGGDAFALTGDGDRVVGGGDEGWGYTLDTVSYVGAPRGVRVDLPHHLGRLHRAGATT